MLQTTSNFSRVGARFDFPRPWFVVCILIVIGVSLMLRITALQNTTLLDDHDSTFYVKSIEAFSSGQWHRINSLNSDSTPTYPFFSALLAQWAPDPATSGRLASLIASCVLMLALVLIASRLHTRMAGLIAATLLATNPLSVSLSVAILTEMTYQALVYVGMYLVLHQFTSKNLSTLLAALIAIVFGLSFLTKTEGILFLVLCPVVVFAGRLFVHNKPASISTVNFSMARWVAVFLILFSIIAALQVFHVSKKMGAPVLNGRIAWQTLVAYMPERSLNAAIYGLDLDHATTNIAFARSNYPEAVRILSESSIRANNDNVLIERLKLSTKNLDTIYRYYLGDLFTPLGIFFLFFGLLNFLVRRSWTAMIFSLFMLAGVMVAPVIHTSVIPRQMAQAIPLFCIIQAIGIVESAALIFSRARKFSRILYLLTIAFFLSTTVAGQAVPIYKSMHPPDKNYEYDPAFLEKPASILRQDADNEKLAARKAYLSYLSGTESVHMPFTDLAGLINYLKANNTKYIYLDYELLKNFPFTDTFINGGAQLSFQELWSESENGQIKAALYALKIDDN